MLHPSAYGSYLSQLCVTTVHYIQQCTTDCNQTSNVNLWDVYGHPWDSSSSFSISYWIHDHGRQNSRKIFLQESLNNSERLCRWFQNVYNTSQFIKSWTKSISFRNGHRMVQRFFFLWRCLALALAASARLVASLKMSSTFSLYLAEHSRYTSAFICFWTCSP